MARSTPSDRIVWLVTDELQRHCSELGVDNTIRSITITVKLNDAGYPRSVIFIKQSERDLRDERRQEK
jgi:hypothetical protein